MNDYVETERADIYTPRYRLVETFSNQGATSLTWETIAILNSDQISIAASKSKYLIKQSMVDHVQFYLHIFMVDTKPPFLL